MKNKIELLLTQKIKAVEELNKDYESQGATKFLCEDYSNEMDKLETEIDLLKLLLL